MSTTTAAPVPDDGSPRVWTFAGQPLGESCIPLTTAGSRSQQIFDAVVGRAIAPDGPVASRGDVVSFWLDEPSPPHIRAMTAAAALHRRRNIAWNVDEDHPTFVPDFTAHAWPDGCMARSGPVATLPGLRPRHFVCTRRGRHTGRHAAGSFGRIVAVWWDR